MDTTKSEALLDRFRNKTGQLTRRQARYGGTWKATPQDVFPLLCPTREADWIPGWDCRLIYTDSGYAEELVMWTTDENNPALGEAFWVFTDYQQDEYVKFVVFKDDLMLHVRIDVKDNGDGTTSGIWRPTFTALTEQGNVMLENLPSDEERSASLSQNISKYLKQPDTSKSEALLKRFRDGPQYKRRFFQYGGTFETTMDTLFPLFCPTREADWIPDWSAALIFTESGWAEEKAIFSTPEDSVFGKGLWTITEYRKNDLIEFCYLQEDLFTFVRLFAVDNNDGTVTATWNTTVTAVTEKGNSLIDSLPNNERRSAALSQLINQYLKGQTSLERVLVH